MRVPRPVWIILILSIALAALFTLDAIPVLRGEVGWQWRYEPAAFARMLPLALGILAYVGGAYWLLRRTTRIGWTIVWSMAGAIILTLFVINVRADSLFSELFARTASTLTTGVYTAGTQIPLDSPAWRDWISLIAERPDLGAHVVNGPPGLPLVYSLGSAGLDAIPGISDPLYRALLPLQCQNYNLLTNTSGQWAVAWLGILMPLWSALAVIPLYTIARRLPGTRENTRHITLWFPLIPALGLFAGTWYTFYPAWVLTAFWLMVSGLDDYRPIRIALSGLVMGFAVFMAYALLPVIGFFGLFVLLRWWLLERRAGTTFLRPVLVGLWFGIGLALPWLFYGLWSGESFFTLLAASLNQHFGLERPYLPWVFLHYWDWMLFGGFTLFLLWYAGLFRRTETPPVLGIALLAAMVILCLSGTARGETGRVWLAFTPFVLLAAGEGLKTFQHKEKDSHPLVPTLHQMESGSGGEVMNTWLLLSLAQALILLALTFSLNVMRTDFVPPSPPPLVMAGLQPTDATFTTSSDAGTFRLVGWNATAENGLITLNLAWEGVEQNTHPYWFGALLVAPDGSVTDAGVWQPGQLNPVPANSPDALRGTYPTTCWSTDVTLGDTMQLPLPSNAPPGEWWISLAAFGDPGTADGRLSVILPDGSTDAQVGLGPVLVSQ